MTAWLASVRLATTENLDDDGRGSPRPLTPKTLDGITVKSGDEILVKDQTDPIQNGNWVAAARVRLPMTRRTRETFEPESTVRVSEGDRNAHTEWSLKAPASAIVVGTDPLPWIRDVTTHAFDSIEAMKAYPGTGGLQLKDTATVAGYSSPGDGGGGDFTFIGVPDDGSATIAGAGDAPTPVSVAVSAVAVANGVVTVTTAVHGLPVGGLGVPPTCCSVYLSGDMTPAGPFLVRVTSATDFTLVGVHDGSLGAAAAHASYVKLTTVAAHGRSQGQRISVAGVFPSDSAVDINGLWSPGGVWDDGVSLTIPVLTDGTGTYTPGPNTAVVGDDALVVAASDPLGLSGGLWKRTVTLPMNVRWFGGVPDWQSTRTGSITVGTPDLVVNDATGLVIGQHIVVEGVTGSKQITAISGLNVTLASDAVAVADAIDAPVYTDNFLAFDSAVAAMSPANSNAGVPLLVHGRYFLSDTLHTTKNLVLQGSNSNYMTHGPASDMVFPGGCDGVRFHSGQGGDDAPNGDSGSAGGAMIRDISITCKDWDADIENLSGITVTETSATGYLRRYGGAPWAGAATVGTSARHGFESAGGMAPPDPLVGKAFREFDDNGGAGVDHGLAITQYPRTAKFNGTQYLVGDAVTKLANLISPAAYSLQFIVEFTADPGATSTIDDEPSLLSEDSGDALFLTFTRDGISAGHRDAGGIKQTPRIPLVMRANRGFCVQVVFTGVSLECRVDGRPLATVPAGPVDPALAALVPRIGANGAGTKFITGRIAQVITFDSALSWATMEDLRTAARIAYGYGKNRGHGIRTQAPITVDNVNIERFGENGLAMFGGGDFGGPIWGSTDGMIVRGGSIGACGGHGLHCWGSDTQGGHFADILLAVNNGWGVFDQSLSGNNYDTILCEGNRGQQEELHANRDYVNPGGNATQFTNCYSDEGSLNLFVGACNVDGIIAENAIDPVSTGFVFTGGSASVKPIQYLNERGPRRTIAVMGADPTGTDMIALRWGTLDEGNNAYDTHTLKFYGDAEPWWVIENNGYYRRIMRLPTAQAHVRQLAPWFENGIFLGGNPAAPGMLSLIAHTSPPDTQYLGDALTYEQGDVVWQSEPVAGGDLGRVCLAKGTQSKLRSPKTTGTILAASNSLSLVDATGFAVGQHISIAGLGIRHIDIFGGAVATLDSPNGGGDLIGVDVAVKMIGTIANGSRNLDVDDPARLVIGQYIAIAGVTKVKQITAVGAPGSVTSASEPYVFADGLTLDVKIDGRSTQTVTFHPADFSTDITVATAVDVARRLDAVLTDSATTAASGKVTITSDKIGATSTVEVTGGMANAVLGFGAGVFDGSDTSVTVDRANANATATNAIIEFSPAKFASFGSVRGTLIVDVTGAPATIALDASYETIRVKGPLGANTTLTVPSEDGWSARVFDDTTGAFTVSVKALTSPGTTASTTQTKTQRMYMEYDGANYNVRPDAPPA